MIREQLLAIRSMALAQGAAVDALLEAVGGPSPAPARAAAAPCAHPPELRLTARRMGEPDAWVCECGAAGSGAAVTEG